MARLPASFRNVDFLVESADDQDGRVVIAHEIPGRVNRIEDTGPETPEFSIEAFVIGPNYASQLRRLEDALTQDGPGKLVHPYRGTKQVQVNGKFRVRQSTREGGMARLVIPFILAGKQAPTLPGVDTAANVKAVSARLRAKMTLPKLDVSGPDFLTKAVGLLLKGPRGLTNELAKINDSIQSRINLVNEISTAIDNLSSEANSLLRTPSVLALAIQDLINSVLTAVGSGVDTVKSNELIAQTLANLAQLGTLGDRFPAVLGTTTARNKQRDNQSDVFDLIESSALASSLDQLVDLDFDNTDQADETLQATGAVFDRLLQRGTMTRDAAQAMRALRAAFHTHLRRSTKDLTGLGRYTPPRDTQALVLAYRLFGDATRAREIVERNSIANACAIPGLIELAIPNA
jgi:hypothetical protein